jgi:serine protease
MIASRIWSTVAAGILAASLLGSAAFPARAQDHAHKTPQLIIKFRSGGERAKLAPTERVALLAVETGIPMVHQRSMAFGLEVVSLFRSLPVGEAEATAAMVARHPDVDLAEPDYLRHYGEPHAAVSPAVPAQGFSQKLMPNDSLLQYQTYLDDSVGGINAFAAWDITTGSASTVVAVVDTGITHHVDLAGRTVPGYCFVSNALIANNSDCRGPDFYDPGDWVSLSDLDNPAFAVLIAEYNLTCQLLPSEWHGTAVAGIIAASGNNGVFLAGLNWQTRILPVRVYGKCLDGFDSDVLDGIAWASGLSVPGVPDNANPAQVINLSAVADLTTACNPLWQDAVNQIYAHGVTRAIVAAAGNDHEDVANRTPASCNGVIAVAATNRGGGPTIYSNYGAGVTLSAPGGDASGSAYVPLDQASIAVLWDAGMLGPMGDSWTYGAGTSYATPMVSGVISLMLAVAPNLTTAQIRSILTSTAKPFPPAPPYSGGCTTAICGAGILDAHAAVLAAQTGSSAGLSPDLNQHGLTGSWYNPATSGQGLEVEVYPDLSPGNGFAQVSWFTFDTAAGLADHERWYTLSGAVTSRQPSAALTIYQNTGGNFNAAPATMAQAVGTATLSFATCSSGELSYNFTDGSGRTGNIPLTRLTQNVTCATTTPFPANTDFAHSGNWYDPATAGQGFTVEVNPVSSYLFAAWYTYAPMGEAAGAAGQRWYTAQGTFTAGLRSIPVTIYETTGGVFNMPAPAAQTVPVGSGTLAFQSCTAATFSYTFTGGSSSGLSGTINLSRVGPVPPGCMS